MRDYNNRMKTIMRRPSTLLSRAVLAAFLVALPGSREAFAQVVSKVGAVSSGVGATGAIGTTLAGVTATPGLSTTLSPSTLNLTPLSAPSAMTPSVMAAPAALVPTAGLTPIAITPTALAVAPKAAAAIPTARAALDGAVKSAKPLSAPALSGGDVKSAAAAAFDGSTNAPKKGSDVSGVPSALTPRRSAPSSTDLVPAQPSREQVEKIRDAIVANTKPGEALDRTTLSQLAVGAGVPVTQGLLAAEALASESQLMRLSGGIYIYSAAVQRDSSGRNDPMIDKANSVTIDGIDQLNARGFSSHLRSLASFGEALRLLTGAGADKARAEVAILYQNAALELTRDLLAEYDRSLRTSDENADTATKRRMVANAQRATINQFYTAGKADPVVFDHNSRTWLTTLLTKLSPSDDSKKGPNGAAVVNGWALLQAYHKGAPLPDDGVKEVPPAERRKALFPLIDKGDEHYKALNTYGINVSRSAVEGKLPPMIGRKAELRQIVKTLLRVEKNNPLIIGEKGVGKTAIANGLAQMIVNGEIPELVGVNIIKLDLTKVVAGTKYRGEFEERMVKILEETRASNGKVRLFIDEIHMLIGAGGASGSQDAANILKEALVDRIYSSTLICSFIDSIDCGKDLEKQLDLYCESRSRFRNMEMVKVSNSSNILIIEEFILLFLFLYYFYSTYLLLCS